MDLIDGKYISSGSKNLYTRILGKGKPVVIIETDWGGLSVEWQYVQKELSKETMVISYDRAGYGESPEGEKPRSSMQIIDEVFNMLQNAGTSGPYIFIGHSLGGLFAQHFAKTYPVKMAGLILVDSISHHDKEFDELDAPLYQKNASTQTRAENMKKYLDMDKKVFEHVTVEMLSEVYKSLDPSLKDQLIAYQSNQDLYRAIVDEYEARDQSLSQVAAIKDFPNIPVSVISRDSRVMIELSKQIGLSEEEAKMVEELWLKHQKSLLELSTDSNMIIAEGSDHNIQFTRPDVIIEETKKIIKKATKLFM